MKHLVEDELTEYRAMLDEVSEGSHSTGERAAHLQRLLRDAEQAGRRWATDVRDDAEVAGLAKSVKQHMKATSRVTHNKADHTAIIGVRRTIEGREQWHQESMLNVTRRELSESLDLAKVNAKTLRRNVRLMERVLRLFDEVPSALTAGEALAKLGVTLEQYLDRAA